MRIMPVTNQNHLKAKTSFKGMVEIQPGVLINENNIVSARNDGQYGNLGLLSYFDYTQSENHDLNNNPFNYMGMDLVTVRYSYRTGDSRNFVEALRDAIKNSDDSIAKRYTVSLPYYGIIERVPVYEYNISVQKKSKAL